jgi:hypothetical protein
MVSDIIRNQEAVPTARFFAVQGPDFWPIPYTYNSKILVSFKLTKYLGS